MAGWTNQWSDWGGSTSAGNDEGPGAPPMFSSMGADMAFGVESGQAPGEAWTAAAQGLQASFESTSGPQWAAMEPVVAEGRQEFDNQLGANQEWGDCWNAAESVLETAAGAKTVLEGAMEAGQQAFNGSDPTGWDQSDMEFDGATAQARFEVAMEQTEEALAAGPMPPPVVEKIVEHAKGSWEQQPNREEDPEGAMQTVEESMTAAVGGVDGGAAQAAGAAGSAAWTSAIGQGRPAEEAIEAAAEAVKEIGTEQGMDSEVLEAAVNSATESYSQAVNAGQSADAAFETAGNTWGAATGQMTTFEAAGASGEDAFWAAMGEGEDPTAAFETAISAAKAAAEEAGINPESFEAVAGSAQSAFNAALEGGGSPESALTAAGEAAGNTLGHNGHGSEHGPGVPGQGPEADPSLAFLGEEPATDAPVETSPVDNALGEALDNVTAQGGQPLPHEPPPAPEQGLDEAGYPDGYENNESSDTGGVA